jgi:hypothetical protein
MDGFDTILVVTAVALVGSWLTFACLIARTVRRANRDEDATAA